MKIKLLLVGKTDNKHLSALIEEYESRISHYLPYEEIIIPELRNAKNLSEEQQKQQEGSEILRRIGVSDRMVLLDERGDENRSIEFASWLTRQMNSGVKTLWLVVGGPYGFSKAVYDRANGMISLSRMTFSHQMIRLIITEQIYRALTIINHEPYHHE
ncbi:MAG: 23S rRNA (pseudouridine(1915)-N(3))-methyltransferase RlmH [Paludibacteraceae bacterium]|nr:23S rRNA (pseudouridine(1915)-N(3))-methyltransferase RlmH [Paludibacteraceae bacterium]